VFSFFRKKTKQRTAHDAPLPVLLLAQAHGAEK